MPKLRRAIGLLEVTFYGIGIIIGAGIYALIGPAAGMTGNSLWISFIVGAVIASFTGLSYAELVTMFPKAAAEYVYVKKAFDSKFIAFLVGWLLVFTGVISAATVSLGFAGYFRSIFNFPIIPVALSLIAVLSYVNFRGIRESSRFNFFFVSVTIAGLLAVILIGVPHFGKVNYLEMPFGWKGVFSATALIFFAYLGFEDIVNVAEETKRPKKVIPRAIILAVAVTTLLYVLIAISATSLVDWKSLSGSSAPLALAVSKALGQKAFVFVSVTALFATASTVLMILVVTSRMMYGMAKERSLPRFLCFIHRKTRTPWLAVIIATALSMLFVFLGDIKLVAHLTTLSLFVTFAVVNVSLIWLRCTMPKARRVFRTPLNVGNYPIMAFLGLFTTLFMMFQFEMNLVLFGLGILAAGAAAYFIFMRKRG